MNEHILKIQGLQTFFFTHAGAVKAVDDVSLSIRRGEMVGIVGESGCGKSVLARSVMRLIPNPPGRIVGGRILFEGRNILGLSKREIQKVRGGSISMIFQEPMTSLNPVYTVGAQIAEVFSKHQNISKKSALDEAVSLLKLVGIPEPAARVNEYPFQMSGGMRQRVVIAMALACRPKLILADEPTTALDVTIQAQILELIRKLRREMGTAMILITHDLGVIAETVARVVVMYAGKVFEEAAVGELFSQPLHPYTEGLMWSMPSFESDQNKDNNTLQEIPGIVPNLSRLPAGCSFYPRCHRKMEVCPREAPPLVEHRPGHWVRCWRYE